MATENLVGGVYDVYRWNGHDKEQTRLRRVQVVRIEGNAAVLRQVERFVPSAFYPVVSLNTLRDKRSYKYVQHEPLPAGWLGSSEQLPLPAATSAVERTVRAAARAQEERIIDDVRIGDIVEVLQSKGGAKMALCRVSHVDAHVVRLDVIDHDQGIRLYPVLMRSSFKTGRFRIRLDERPADAQPAPQRAVRSGMGGRALNLAPPPPPAPAPAPAPASAPLLEQVRALVDQALANDGRVPRDELAPIIDNIERAAASATLAAVQVNEALVGVNAGLSALSAILARGEKE